MSPQAVKPDRTGDKTNPNEAAAICEAVSRPQLRFMALKSIEPQDMQALHRLRAPLVKDRTALVNYIRGLLAEDGVVIPQGIAKVGQALPWTDGFRTGVVCQAGGPVADPERTEYR